MLRDCCKSRRQLEAEILVLRHQLNVLRQRAPRRLYLSWADRALFIWLYRGFPRILEAIIIVRPETVVRWHRMGFAAYWRWKSRPLGGRPRIGKEVRDLIRRMSFENPLWGAPKIHGELLKIGIDVAHRRFLTTWCPGEVGHCRPGRPSFAIMRTGLRRLISLWSRRLPLSGYLHSLFSATDGGSYCGSRWPKTRRRGGWRAKLPRHSPGTARRDFSLATMTEHLAARSKLASEQWVSRDRPTSFRSPWQNGYVERLIGSIRRECTDHVIVVGEHHLRRTLAKYATYYNETRTHVSLGKDTPCTRPIERFGEVVAHPILGGLHHRYAEFSFQKRQLGIAELAGSGGESLCRTLFGAERADSGEIVLDGRPIRLREPPSDRGISFVCTYPAQRLRRLTNQLSTVD